MLGMWTSTNLKKENHHNSKWLTDNVHWIVKDRNWDSDYKVIPKISCLKSQVKSYKKVDQIWEKSWQRPSQKQSRTKKNKSNQKSISFWKCFIGVFQQSFHQLQISCRLESPCKNQEIFLFVLLQFKIIVWQWYTFIPYETSPPPHPTPPPHPNQTCGRQKTKRKKEQILQLLISTLPVYY